MIDNVSKVPYSVRVMLRVLLAKSRNSTDPIAKV